MRFEDLSLKYSIIFHGVEDDVNFTRFTHQHHCFNDFEKWLNYERDIISKLLQQIRFIANHFRINEEEAEVPIPSA